MAPASDARGSQPSESQARESSSGSDPGSGQSARGDDNLRVPNPQAGPVNPHGSGDVPKKGGMMAKIKAQEAAEKAAREKDLAALDDNALYIIIYLRAGLQNNFHWGLYLHSSGLNGGHKFHIRGNPGQAWYPDHGDTSGALASRLLFGMLLGMLRIKLPVGQPNAVATAITQADGNLSDRADMTCRVYVKEACERLKQAGLLDFSVWNQLEAEVFALGNRENPVMAAGMQTGNFVKPRPVQISQIAS